MIRVYLAGNIFETRYRDYVKKTYGDKLEILDPISENGAIVDPIHEKINHIKSFDEIVENDKEMIYSSDIFVAIFNKMSAGTIMEILYAWNRQIPVYLIIPPNSKFENDIWLSYHTTKFFYTTDSCYEHILNQITIT